MRNDQIVIPMAAIRRLFVMIIVIIVLALGILILRTQLFRAGIASLFAPGAAEVIDRNAYQAVFLTNGATYFGKLQPQGDDWFLLSDVFYLAQNADGGTQLIKRGTEPQGPREPMIIPRDQVLFIENMRDESDVANLIKRFKSGQLPTSTAPPTAAAPSTPLPTAPRPSASPSPSR